MSEQIPGESVMMDLRARAALVRAADWLETNQWIQRCSARFKDGAVISALHVAERVSKGEQPVACCAVGAITTVVADRETMIVAWNAMDLADAAFVPQGLAWWNDQPGRTRDEVVDALRRVARTP